MQLVDIIKFIINHPLNRKDRIKAFSRFIRWQVASRILNEALFLLPFINETKLLVKKGMTGATGNWYSKLHETDEMLFILRSLREEDLFVDIGANIGSYSILASGVVGAKTISFEPIPSTFEYLTKNLLINNLTSKVNAICMGLSDKVGKLNFTSNLDTVNHITRDDISAISVPVSTLNLILKDNHPTIIKIDVEGYEIPVLNGGSRILDSSKLIAILIETNGSGERYGYKDQEIFDLLNDYGFKPYYYNGIDNILYDYKTGQQNTIFLKDKIIIEDRLKNTNFILN